MHKQYKKLHVVCGTKSNIIFACKITDGNVSDNPTLPELLDESLQIVQPRELSADAGYLSRKNVDYTASKGILPYIKPKKNVSAKNRGSSTWGQMITYWQTNKDLFNLHYNQRSNVESVFSMLKRKLSDYTRAKTDTGQTNEILTKIVCHNTIILAQTILEYPLIMPFTDK